MANNSGSKPGGVDSHHADTQTLTELNQRSASIGLWDVSVFRPTMHYWKYKQKSSGQERNGADFRCTLVSVHNPEQYVSAHITMRSDKMGPLQQAEAKFKANLKFRISKVGLDNSAKQEFMHTPVKHKVDLSRTKADPLMKLKEGEIIQPHPSMPLTECKQLQQNQRFDVTAILDQVSEVRAVNAERQVVSLTLLDDSGDEGKPVQLTISYFMDLPLGKEDTETMENLLTPKEDAVKQVLSFFAVQGKRTDKGYTFEADSKKDFFIVTATGPRAKHLAEVAGSLQAIPQEQRDILQQATYEHHDYENEEGAQTLCKLLSELASITDISKLNEKPTVWSAQWVEVGWPMGDTLLKKDGSQLWFQTSLRDVSGVVERVWVNEASALSLSQLPDKEAFMESHAKGNQLFPIMSAVKVVREARLTQDNGDVSQLADSKTEKKPSVNLVLVQAVDQPLNEAPSKAALEMIPLLRDLKDDTSAVLPAALDMVSTSPHYAFTVCCKPSAEDSKVYIPCQKVVALVRTSKRTEASNLGDGFKLTTSGVEDLLSTGAAGQTTHTLSAICTLKNLTQYKLDPPRGKSQAAIVLITAKANDSWVVESVQTITEEDATQAKQSFLQLLNLAMHIYNRDRRRKVEWNDDFSPIASKKCRFMGRSPTDAPLPDPGCSGGA